MPIHRFLIYDNVFSKYNKEDPIKLIEGISSIKLLHLLSRLNVILWSRENDQIVKKSLLNSFIDNFSVHFSNKIKNIFSKNPKYYEYILFNNISNLFLEQFTLDHFTEEDTELKKENYENIFKLILYFNQYYNNIIKSIGNAISQEDFLGLSLALGFAQNGFMISNINELTYIIKGFYFFKFIESDSLLQKHLIGYLRSRNTENYKFILCHIRLIYLTITRSSEKNIPEIVPELVIDKQMKDVIHYLDTMALSFPKDIDKMNLESRIDFETPQKTDLDFKLFRNFPLFKKEENRFYFFNLNFFADKLFPNLKFDFKNYVESTLDWKIDYFKYVSLEFTEKYLFRKIINSIYQRESSFCREGKNESDDTPEYGDFYIRIGNKVFLFECKDTIIREEYKHGYKCDEIKKILIEKFAGPKQGIVQLLKVIKNFEESKITFDSYVLDKINHIQFYPIIIYTDTILETNGVNYFLNQKFIEMKKSFNLNLKVNNLIMINLDFMIKYKELFINHFVKILEIMNEFSNIVKEEQLPNTSDPQVMYPTLEETIQVYMKREISEMKEIKDEEYLKILEELNSASGFI